MDNGKLTPQQIENWRNVMLGTIGPAALFLSDDEIQAYRDRMQEIADSLEM